MPGEVPPVDVTLLPLTPKDELEADVETCLATAAAAPAASGEAVAVGVIAETSIELLVDVAALAEAIVDRFPIGARSFDREILDSEFCATGSWLAPRSSEYRRRWTRSSLWLAGACS